MNQGLVTVVLPIYNVEKYLDRCIKSVVNQTYENLEIILVDDESPDRCPEMCEEWAKRDKRIKVIHKKNAGLGIARNSGIDNANGEYICFVDSDDYVALDTIEKAYALAKKEQADIVTFGFYNVKSNGSVRGKYIPKPEKKLYEGEEIQVSFLPDLIGPDTSTGRETNLWMSAWAAFYSMQLIHRSDWRFVSEREIISEDVYSLLRLYKNVERVAVLQEALYFYCENVTSLTHTYKKDRFEKIKLFYDESIRVCEELEYNKNVKDRLSYPFISNSIAALKMIACANCEKQERESAIYAILKDQKLHDVISNTDMRHEKILRKALLIAIKCKFYSLAKLMIMAKAYF